MDTFFCAEESRQIGEDPIGCAVNHQIYVLVECPPPWSASAFASKFVPANLRALIEEGKKAELPVKPLLISSDNLKQEHYTKVLIFRKQDGISARYSKQEFQVSTINDVAPLVKDCLAGNHPSDESAEAQTRDILVCTHGSNDKCCAKYGHPFYRQALATVSGLSVNHVRIWQASHIGGHRFAPTAIDFPDGRYYGRLDQESFTAILTRTGDIKCLNNVYRGWGILPWAAQVLERELILMHGWDWFNYKVACQIVEQNEDESFNRVELTFEKPDGSAGVYRADVVEDESKTIYLRGDCDSTEAYKTPQYSIKNLVMLQHSSVVS